MLDYSENDFCSEDEGLDYIFTKLGAIFGATFMRHFDGLQSEVVRQVWKEQIGKFLTYRPSMDFAIQHLNSEFIPSAIKFRELCNLGPSIPTNQLKLENNPTPLSPEEHEKAKAEGLEKMRELRKMFKGAF
jgi:hypothetical protein